MIDNTGFNNTVLNLYFSHPRFDLSRYDFVDNTLVFCQMVGCSIVIGSSNIVAGSSNIVAGSSNIVAGSCNISCIIITPNGGDKLGTQVYLRSKEMGLLHPADIFCDTRTVFLNIAHLVHHLRQVWVVWIRAVFFHQVGFGEFNRQSSWIVYHDMVAEDRNLHTPRAIVKMIGIKYIQLIRNLQISILTYYYHRF